MGNIRSVPLGVQTEPGLIDLIANSRRTHHLYFGPVE